MPTPNPDYQPEGDPKRKILGGWCNCDDDGGCGAEHWHSDPAHWGERLEGLNARPAWWIGGDKSWRRYLRNYAKA